ncbi:MAG: hypothetical protein KF736_12395 [Acidobacteria bacterium]|nr:hypothetical protein [Acidobacteriota bacterium]MCW5950492.1 hypothetical protein [Pyrinomonadaceae bacterium]
MAVKSSSKGPSERSKARKLQDDFAELSLEEKVQSLFKMEALTLTEALRDIADSSMKLVGEAERVLAELGRKFEQTPENSAASGSGEGESGKKRSPRSKKPGSGS